MMIPFRTTNKSRLEPLYGRPAGTVALATGMFAFEPMSSCAAPAVRTPRNGTIRNSVPSAEPEKTRLAPRFNQNSSPTAGSSFARTERSGSEARGAGEPVLLDGALNARCDCGASYQSRGGGHGFRVRSGGSFLASPHAPRSCAWLTSALSRLASFRLAVRLAWLRLARRGSRRRRSPGRSWRGHG
jgi:hypothetical protein